MYKVLIKGKHTKSKIEKFFSSYANLLDYFKKTFNFYEKYIFDDLETLSCDVSFWINDENKKPLYDVSIESWDFFDITDSIPKAYSMEKHHFQIYEVFNHVDAVLIEKEFNKYVSLMNSKESCVDSFRIGLTDDIDSMNEYNTYISCCGSDDRVIKINNTNYTFGCNFGH